MKHILFAVVILIAVPAFAQSVKPVNSPAYQSYKELLDNPDAHIVPNTYACFEDDQQSTFFRVIGASVMGGSLEVSVVTYTKGVLDSNMIFFSGPISPFSNPSAKMLFATTISNEAHTDEFDSAHWTDSFEWGPDILVMKTGFGKLPSYQLRITGEFRMQRATGRYTYHVFMDTKPDGITQDETGVCEQIPGYETWRPEESFYLEWKAAERAKGAR